MPADTQAGTSRIDLASYQLSVNGRRVRLERQPLELLIFLVQRKGQLVTREEIVEKLWGNDVFVDVDASINAAIRKIRSALRDAPANPKYIETVVGKGYRFTGNIELIALPSSAAVVSGRIPRPAIAPRKPWSLSRIAIVPGMLVLLLATTAWVVFHWRQEHVSNAPVIRSIVVLPLTNFSGDPSQNYFADGMTDEITTDLAKVSSLKVISRTSAMRYQATSKPLREIARELQVDAIVEGSVVRAGDKVRVTAQLIDAINDRHIWAETYERDLGDVLSVQNTVALEIARQVRARLTPSDQQRLGRSTPVNPDAYDAYLRGRYAQTTQSAESLKAGLVAFQQAIALDPTFAPAYAGLADAYSLLANYWALSPGEAFPQAEAAARKALELDPSSPEAHTALAYPLHHYTWQWAAAEQEYRTAIALSPSYATAHLRYAEYLSSVGRHEESIAEMHRAMELDPLSLVYAGNLGRFLYQARRYDEAMEVLRKTLEVDPGRVYSRLHLAMCYEQKEMYVEAAEQLKQVRKSRGNRPTFIEAHLLARMGHRAEALGLTKQFRQGTADSDWFWLAGVYAALNEKDQAFACLQKAYEKHDFFLVFLKVHPYMDPLRTDPRYAELAHRMGLP